jgi:hypothetical protein
MPRYTSIAEFRAQTGDAAPTPAELNLIAKCLAAEHCTLGDDCPTAPTAENTIRADLLRLLITGGSADCGLSGDGVWLEGAWITGPLNLQYTNACGQTVLNSCHFTSVPQLTHAKLNILSLQDCDLPGLMAQDLYVAGSVLFRRLAAKGTIHLSSAHICGQLDFTNAILNSNNAKALYAQGLIVGQDVFLRGLVASGTVAVNGADIGGQLACEGANLNGGREAALNASGLTTRADLFLQNIIAVGTVDVSKAQIGGQMDCTGARLIGNEGIALRAQGLITRQDLMLRRIVANGTVDVNGAQVGGQMACEGAVFTGNGDLALFAQRLQVAAGLFWSGITITQGRVTLASAHVGDLADDMTSWPDSNSQLYLDGFTYDRLSGAPADIAARLSWLAKGAIYRGVFHPQPYTQLAKVLAEMGHDRDARKVLEERSRLLGIASRARKPEGWQRRHYLNPVCYVTFGASWLFDRVSQLVVGYGHAPHRALYSLTFLFLIATTLASAAWNEGSFAPNSDVIITSPGWTRLVATDCVPEKTDGCLKNPAAAWSSFGQDGLDWDTFNPYGYGLDLVVPILTLGQTDAWAPSKDRGPMGKLLWWGRWVLISFGWIVSALGAAAITGIIQRK